MVLFGFSATGSGWEASWFYSLFTVLIHGEHTWQVTFWKAIISILLHFDSLILFFPDISGSV